MERDGRIKEIAFWRIKEKFKNIVLFENLFLGRKIRPKMPKIRFFPPKIFFGKSFSIFGGIFGESQGGHFYEIKKFQR